MNDLSTIARTPVEMLAPVIEKIDRPHKKSHFFADVAPVKPRVVLTHGENGPRTTLAELISDRHGLKPILPELGEVIEL